MGKSDKLWTRSMDFVKENLWLNYGQIMDKFDDFRSIYG